MFFIPNDEVPHFLSVDKIPHPTFVSTEEAENFRE